MKGVHHYRISLPASAVIIIKNKGTQWNHPSPSIFQPTNPPFPPKILWQVLMLLLFRLTSNFWGRNAGKYGSKKLKWGSVINGRVANES